jgi:hypothetical protein
MRRRKKSRRRNIRRCRRSRQAGDDGSWQAIVDPATDFVGAYPGKWHVSFCLVNTAECWSGDITISL